MTERVIRLDDVRSIPDMTIGDTDLSNGHHTPVELLELETWRQFADLSHDQIPCLIDGLWPEAAFGFVASPPKKGKTWIGLSLAISVATGSPFLGRFDIPQPQPVLYLALEGHRSALTHRIAAIARGHGHDPDQEIPNLTLAYKPRGINIADPVWADWLTQAADTTGAKLIIVDVLRAAARIKENDATEFASLRANLQPVTDHGVSIALLHHFTKLSETSKERTPGERMSGSGAMYGALDVGIYITGSDDNARSLRLEFETRDISSPPRLGARLEGAGSGPNGGLTYRDRAWWIPSTPPDEDDVDVPAEAIRDWLVENGGEATRSQIVEAMEISERTVKRREVRLAQLGVKIREAKGRRPVTYIIDPVGWTPPEGGHVHPTDVSTLDPSVHAETRADRTRVDTPPCPPSESADLQGDSGWTRVDSYGESSTPVGAALTDHQDGEELPF